MSGDCVECGCAPRVRAGAIGAVRQHCCRYCFIKWMLVFGGIETGRALGDVSQVRARVKSIRTALRDMADGDV